MPKRSEAEFGWVRNPLHRAKKKADCKAIGFFRLNPSLLTEEIHLRWMKSLRDEIPLRGEKMADFILALNPTPPITKKSHDDILPCRYNITPTHVIRQKKFFSHHLCNLDIYKSRHL